MKTSFTASRLPDETVPLVGSLFPLPQYLRRAGQSAQLEPANPIRG